MINVIDVRSRTFLISFSSAVFAFLLKKDLPVSGLWLAVFSRAYRSKLRGVRNLLNV